MPSRLSASLSVLAIAILTAIASALPVSAVGIPSGDFSLEVSPSPLVTTVKPGVPVRLELKIRNASTKTEELKIQARNFTINHPSEEITIGNTTPDDLAEWVQFSHPTFTVKPGEWFTQNITVTLPDSAGFSYPFSLVIGRVKEDATPVGGNLLKGSIAVFTLINVDKPGATRRLTLSDLVTSQSVYEFLPSTIKLKLKNTGNSFVQPYGNVYIQRSSNDTDPLAVMPVNDARAYILPNSTREITMKWDQGFPRYVTSQPDASGKTTDTLEWDWSHISNFRFGRYTVKVVAVYNDGARDVPVIGEIAFWVIPWRILLGVLIVVLVFGFGIWSIMKRIIGRISKFKQRHKA